MTEEERVSFAESVNDRHRWEGRREEGREGHREKGNLTRCRWAGRSGRRVGERERGGRGSRDCVATAVAAVDGPVVPAFPSFLPSNNITPRRVRGVVPAPRHRRRRGGCFPRMRRDGGTPRGRIMFCLATATATKMKGSSPQLTL